METNIIAIILAPIIAALIGRHLTPSIKVVVASQKNHPDENPTTIEEIHVTSRGSISSQKSLFRKPWLIGLLLLLCMAYVLPEVFSPGELTRMALYKIVMGIGLFFFLLIQSSISNVVDTIYGFKSADLELIKSFSKEFKKGDNP
jgi:hypothetical protein